MPFICLQNISWQHKSNTRGNDSGIKHWNYFGF